MHNQTNIRPILAVLAILMIVPAGSGDAATPAKQLFGKKDTAALLAPAPYGSYAKGCVAGAEPLSGNGAYHQVMRLNRNRFWGHPSLISYIDKLSSQAAARGWRGLLVGDIAQPRGGPMLTGHRSHQIGLDADIWLTPMPDRILTLEEREKLSAISMLDKTGKAVDQKIWTSNHVAVLKTAASFPQVARIFVNPAIKVALCKAAGKDRAWLRKIRPWWGHHYHFHVRLSCPKGAKGCKNQAAPPKSDGCGKELASWFKPPPKPKKGAKKKKPKKRRELVMADLPKSCEAVLKAE